MIIIISDIKVSFDLNVCYLVIDVVNLGLEVEWGRR